MKRRLEPLPESVVRNPDGTLSGPSSDVIDHVLYELPIPLNCSWPKCPAKGRIVEMHTTAKSRPWKVSCEEHVDQWKWRT